MAAYEVGFGNTQPAEPYRLPRDSATVLVELCLCQANLVRLMADLVVNQAELQQRVDLLTEL